MESGYSDDRRAHIRLAALLVIALIALCAWAVLISRTSHIHVLTVVFFDVGQGDAIYIASPTGTQMLIDGGPDRHVIERLSREMGFFDRSLDAVLLTHGDRDHIGGIPEVFARFDIATLIETENQGDNEEANQLASLIEKEGAALVYARKGMVFDLGAGTSLEILFPDRDPKGLETNTSSIIARLVYGDTEFLLTGDAPSSIETYLVETGADLQSDVLKVGHHGSRTSTSEALLAAVHPHYAVISAGKDNRYGHPHEEVLDILARHGIDVMNTAEEGSVTFVSDGRHVMRQ